MNLSDKQKQIVDHINGALLVKAGPGSGKTRVLTERVKHLLSATMRGKVLALTFSNMAAEEMRTRLEKDREVGDAIERVNVSTIHSFCLDLIQSRGNLVGLRHDVALFENDADRLSILRSVFISEHEFAILLRSKQKPDAFLSGCLSMISEQKRSLVSPESCNVNQPFPEIFQRYNAALALQNAIDFDDILFYSYRILAENRDVVKLYNSVYKFVCIDEAQDLNNAQYRVIQAFCGDTFRNIMMVGDENQSIYAFNGSSSKYMSELFVEDFAPTIYTLDENFRSARQIIQFANSLTGSNDDVSKYYYEGVLAITAYTNENDEATSVCSQIADLIATGHKDIEGSLTYDSFAIIARNKYVFSCVENELTTREIPFYYKKTQSGIACETDYMQAFDLILRLTMNPMDIYHKQMLCKLVSSALTDNTVPTTISTEIQQLLATTKFNWLSAVLPTIVVDGTINFDDVLKTLRNNMPQLPDDERYLLEKDITEWQKHWDRFKSHIPSENRSLISFRNAISLGKTQDILADSGVTLLTAHMSKGLEFEVVFVIGLSEGTFPDYRAVSSGGDYMTQEKNNFYVAVTRAKRLCFLSYPEVKRMPWGDMRYQRPSRFITDYIS